MPQYAKVPVKDIGIDHQILQLHAAMAKKCFANPALFEQIEARIETRYAAKQMRYGAYLTWLSILELKHQPEEMLAALLEKSFKMRNLRRATVFTGVLDEDERLAVIESLHRPIT
ncbi:hypothetical protein [Brumicola blandensis]|uniref:Uncharacterized protein n=1 Tax=Brumicola blandensis TaxID=3075611 RepID=A0AAW8R1R5_9ALTE|nr:hypothetical protein [Alteromonas sp. W409]MDT0581098.1 hypothetical protein [Alteromonas sp. W409]